MSSGQPLDLCSRPAFLPVVRKVVETENLLRSPMIGDTLDDFLGTCLVPIDPEGH
jgi:hypothetical protein